MFNDKLYIWIKVSQLIMSLTLARSERVRNLLTHANLTELVL